MTTRIAFRDSTGREVGSIIQAASRPVSAARFAVWVVARSLHLWDAARHEPRRFDTAGEASAALERAGFVEVAEGEEWVPFAARVVPYPRGVA